MKKMMQKVSAVFVGFLFIFTFIGFLTTLSPAYAVENEQLLVTYDGSTKVISNVQNFLNATPITRSFVDKDQMLLETIGFTASQIECLEESEIEIYTNAKKIYSLSQTFYETQTFSTRSSFDSPLTYDDGYVNLVYTLTDDGYALHNLHTFTLSAVARWNNLYPRCRYVDNLCFAWAGANTSPVGAGSKESSYSMSFHKNTYSLGNLIDSQDLTDPSRVSEQNVFPGFAVQYDIYRNTVIPYCIYSDYVMKATTRITVEEDFIAMCSYGHQIKNGSPNASVSTSGFGVSITFDKSFEVYCPGQIRVYL